MSMGGHSLHKKDWAKIAAIVGTAAVAGPAVGGLLGGGVAASGAEGALFPGELSPGLLGNYGASGGVAGASTGLNNPFLPKLLGGLSSMSGGGGQQQQPMPMGGGRPQAALQQQTATLPYSMPPPITGSQPPEMQAYLAEQERLRRLQQGY